MDRFVIEGPCSLNGEVSVSGAKNAVLPIIASTLLASGECVIENVPDLQDVRTMIKLLEMLGAKTVFEDGVLRIDSSGADGTEAPYDLVKTMRASIYVLGPLLASRGKARVSLPGGCAWGPRPVDLHLMAMEQLGANINLKHGYIHAACTRLEGAEIVMPLSSVGATANALMAASLAGGETTIKNAAMEPEIGELAKALSAGGIEIEGIGLSTISIKGARELRPFTHTVIPDRIEAGTLIAAAVGARGKIVIKRCDPKHLDSMINVFRSCGAIIDTADDNISIERPGSLKPAHVVTGEYPKFPTDMQAQVMAVLCAAEGTSTVKDIIYPDRFTHVPELRRLGADIRLDGNCAVITGKKRLDGAQVMATDIRASSALVIGGLMAEGTTEISRVYHIDRGYEKLERKLLLLGAKITRVNG